MDRFNFLKNTWLKQWRFDFEFWQLQGSCRKIFFVWVISNKEFFHTERWKELEETLQWLSKCLLLFHDLSERNNQHWWCDDSWGFFFVLCYLMSLYYKWSNGPSQKEELSVVFCILWYLKWLCWFSFEEWSDR